MTTAQRHIRYNAPNLNLPDIGKFLNSILDALRDHGGKASRDQVTTEAENILRRRYNLFTSSPTLDLEIRNRLERALELLSRTGLVCRKGLHSLSLTSRALIISTEELESIAAETLVKPKIERQLVVPLPDEIAMRVISDLRTSQLTSIEIEEQLLRHYAHTTALLTVDAGALDELRRRTVTARRVLEAKNLIMHDRHGRYTLTDRGRAVSPKQIERITCMSAGPFARHQLLKLRLNMETRAQTEVRNSIIKSVLQFVAGLVHRVQTKPPDTYVAKTYAPINETSVVDTTIAASEAARYTTNEEPRHE
ncbi:MAG: hypothetical protein SGJ27_11590 [Candidatus Melainabacteria bacterium]|nr:hypothetical protein [Candidatus Melainabacteria bacterium]